MLAPHLSSAIEYWFFKVNQGSTALIVDWIERRRSNEHVLRVSIHSLHKRDVMFENLDSFMPHDNFLSQKRTVGHSREVSWDLDVELGSERIRPDIFPAGLLRMPDTLYESAPLATFTGWICHGSEKIMLDQTYGTVTQYWGRQLLPEWWWLSANQFDRESIAVESCVFRSRLWGSSVQTPFAFLYLYRNGKRDFLMAPPNSATVTGSPERFILDFGRLRGKRFTLVGTGRDYGDFGERIINTLTGDLEIFEGDQRIAFADGTAGLERRFPKIRLFDNK